jgi:hypothetical protein
MCVLVFAGARLAQTLIMSEHLSSLPSPCVASVGPFANHIAVPTLDF